MLCALETVLTRQFFPLRLLKLELLGIYLCDSCANSRRSAKRENGLNFIGVLQKEITGAKLFPVGGWSSFKMKGSGPGIYHKEFEGLDSVQGLNRGDG